MQSSSLLRVRVLCAIGLIVIVSGPQAAQSKDLVDVIPELYDRAGPGITLDNERHNAHFEENEGTSGLTSQLDELNSEISSAINELPGGAAVASFTFDLEEAVFVQTTESLGPTVAERPQTIGKGKINFGFSYTRLDFKEFNGHELKNMQLTLNHVPCIAGPGFPAPDNCDTADPPLDGDPEYELDRVLVDLDIELEQDLLRFFGNYGITDKWDVGVVVPVVHTSLKVDAEARVEDHPHVEFFHVFCDPDDDDCDADVANDSEDEDAWGIGDVVLRSKYHLVEADEKRPDVGTFGFVKFNSGDEDDLLGTGHIDFAAFLSVAKAFGIVTPHANAGFQLSTGPSELDSFRYVAGAELMLHRRVTVSSDILGRTALDRDGFGDDIVDMALGVKVNPWSTLSLIGNIIFPLNQNEGLRTDLTWTLGAEYTF